MTLILSANNVTHQEEAAQSSATALVDLKIWLPENITNADVAHFRVKDNNLYKLNTPIPFTTIDFATEFTEGKWSLLIKGSNLDFTQTILNLINANSDRNLIEVKIQGLLVQAAGKTDLTILQDNDLFRYHTADRYSVGTILDASSITIPQDLDDSNKIKLQHDS
jgi:hypothetical protein